MSLQGVKHTTMSDKIRIDICKHHIANPKLTQKELVSWLQQKHYVKVSQGTVINTFKWSTELIQLDPEVANQNSKRHRLVKYPMMKDALVAWFHGHQYRINFSGELVCEAAQQMHGKLHPDHDHSFKFFNGWLEAFKKRNNIRSRRRFGERGRAHNSLATRQLEGLKQNKECISVAVCCNDDGSDKLPLWIIGKFANLSFNRLLLQHLDDKIEQPKKIDVFQAIQLAVPAWSTNIKPTTIHNCFRHGKIRSEPTDVIPIDKNELMDQAIVEELESQIFQFRYPNPMDIWNLLNYSAEDEVAYVQDVDDVVNDQLSNAADDGSNANDDSQSIRGSVPPRLKRCFRRFNYFGCNRKQILKTYFRPFNS
ncbi:hypothetical protein AXG93_3017s1210 [Marchantia polymorpha subsp. ruderalis]|uniref:HTH CENPB-type domain-containing protein n=1 Tax=Marchantia polymorpha subsp. ruderalis TaxID=1480154 RepID=A0A176WID9_MARPO|nr:hypothetical protein AXG93_3017s1210 [Marchantia polymorpha subsp. ruderalis]